MLSFGSRDTQVSINFHLIRVLVAGVQLYRLILSLLLASYTSWHTLHLPHARDVHIKYRAWQRTLQSCYLYAWRPNIQKS